MNCNQFLVCLLIGLALLKEAKCLQKRCVKCRSRGELGSCVDPVTVNSTDPYSQLGIHVVACPSGWCGKMIEGNEGAFRTDDYGSATERMCLQRPPSDYEERCAYTLWNYKKVYMCFCTGDLCNSGFRVTMSYLSIIIAGLVTIFNVQRNIMFRQLGSYLKEALHCNMRVRVFAVFGRIDDVWRAYSPIFVNICSNIRNTQMPNSPVGTQVWMSYSWCSDSNTNIWQTRRTRNANPKLAVKYLLYMHFPDIATVR